VQEVDRAFDAVDDPPLPVHALALAVRLQGVVEPAGLRAKSGQAFAHSFGPGAFDSLVRDVEIVAVGGPRRGREEVAYPVPVRRAISTTSGSSARSSW
jgi:hypothetical protein